MHVRRLVLATVGATTLAGAAGAGMYVPPPGDGSPVWSPDGTAIVYASQRTPRGLHVIRPDGATEGTLPGIPAHSRFAFSADWFWIAYSDVEPSVGEGLALVVSRPDGSARRALGRHDGGPPSWSPDGTRVAFARPEPGGPSDVYTVAVDGTRLAKIAEDGWKPRFSPDGRHIAFVTQSSARSDVVVANADGSAAVNVTASLAGNTYAEPSWNPDGTRLAFVRNPHVGVVRPDGGALRRYRLIGRAGAVDWSPDGRRLLYSAEGATFGGPDGGVFVLDVRTGRQAVISPFGVEATWSPDGARIAFAAGGECKDRVGVYVVEPGRRPVRLTNDCRVTGTGGSDVLRGTDLADVVLGLGGDDRLTAVDRYYMGDDLHGGSGEDVLQGQWLTNVLDGGPGRDRLDGGAGPDAVRGGPGRDSLAGSGGRDVLLAEDGEPDSVSCGTNRPSGGLDLDTAFVDRRDGVTPDCELLYRSGRLDLSRGRTAFSINVFGGNPARLLYKRRLSCDPPRGTVPSPAAACRRLATQRGALAPPSPGTRCAATAGHSFRNARIQGIVGGIPIIVGFSRYTTCEDARWRRHGFLFGPAG